VKTTNTKNLVKKKKKTKKTRKQNKTPKKTGYPFQKSCPGSGPMLAGKEGSLLGEERL